MILNQNNNGMIILLPIILIFNKIYNLVNPNYPKGDLLQLQNSKILKYNNHP
jgi:hypothetical protein